VLWSELAMLCLQVWCLSEAAYRGHSWKAVYWFGALCLTVAVVRGMR
jgi:hypothetical protein